MNEKKLSFEDVAIVPTLNSSRSRRDVQLSVQYRFLHSHAEFTGIPIMNSNMDTTGTFEMVNPFFAEGLFPTLHKHYSVEDFEDHRSWLEVLPHHWVYSIGMSDVELARFEKLKNDYGIEYLMIDVANGYSSFFHAFVEYVRERHEDVTIIAGNVVTGAGVMALVHAGADIVKVGIASGSACATKNKTGVYYPQLSAVMECAKVAESLGAHIISDGGVREAGDFSKAFAAGAHFVMAGGMFAGHDESGGVVDQLPDGTFVKEFYGMSSNKAMHRYGNVGEYRASEGHEKHVPYKGAVIDTVRDILGGVRSTCTYVDAKNLSELPRKAEFIQIN